MGALSVLTVRSQSSLGVASDSVQGSQAVVCEGRSQ